MFYIDYEDTTWIDKIKYIYWGIIPYNWRPFRLLYRVKCAVWHRYTTIKPRTLQHNTWTDRCVLLPHMVFEILTAFIEEECSPGHFDWYGEYGYKITVDGKEKYVMDEMLELYEWWKKVVPDSQIYDYNLHNESEELWAKINSMSNPYCTKHSGYYEYHDGVKEEVKEEYRKLTLRASQIEREDYEIIKRNMCRVCNLYGYMWT